jgi:hypothetical protein
LAESLEIAHGRRWWCIVLPIAVVAMYSPVVFATYGFADDYATVRDTATGDWSWTERTLRGNGRPVEILPFRLVFGLVDDVGSLRWARLVGVVLIAAVAVTVAWLMVRSGRRPVAAACVGLAVAALPPMQIVAGWASLFPVPLAFLLGLAAARQSQAATTRLGVAGACVLLAAAVLIYQPGAMAYFVAITIAATGPRREMLALRRHAVVLLAGAVAAAVGSFAGMNLQDNPDRNRISLDLISTGNWAAHGALPRVLMPFALYRPAIAVAAIGGLLLGGLVRAEGWRRAAALLLLVPASYAPSLATGPPSPASARAMVALAAVVVVLAVRGVEGLLPEGRSSLARNVGIIFAVALAVQATATVWVFIARPAGVEWRAALRGTADAPAGATFAVMGSPPSVFYDAGIVPHVSQDEFGFPSSLYVFAAGPMVQLAAREHTGRWPSRVTIIEGATPSPLGARVVDFPGLIATTGT